MAFTEFDGDLDDEAGFQPFDGELDAPAPTAKPEPGLADRYRGQFEQAKKMMAPAPATSVLDRASRAPAADPMLRPEFIEEQRAIYGKMPEANRLPVLKRMATRDDVQGRAAKVLLAEAEATNAAGRQAERDMPEFARVIAEGPRVAPPAGTGPRKPRPVTFHDAQPDITEIGSMPTEAQTLARRGAGGVLASAASDPATLAERARVDATDWNQVEFARENPVIAGAGSGGARALGGIINAPGTAAQFLAETLLNPISRRLGGDGFERVPNAPLVDGLMQAAQEWSSPQMTQEPMEAWDRDQFGTWLAANVAAQAPMFAQQVVAFMVPAARAMILPGMGAQVAGGEYAGGDSAVAAVGKGAAEAGSELISLGVMDKARSFFLKLPPGQRAAAVKDLAKRVGAASAAMTGSAMGESGTEVLSQLGQNAIDQLAGKDTPLTSGLLASAIVGAVAGGGMMVPAAMTDLRRSSTDGSRMSVEDALIQALETGQTRPAPPVIRVEDMPTTPLTPEQVAAIAPAPQVEPIPTGEATELPGMPTEPAETIPTGQATELAGPRAATPADLGISSVPQGSLAAMAEQQLRARFVQPELPADAPLAAPAADAGRDQPGRSGGALGRMADDGRTGSVLPAEPVPAGSGGADQPAAAGTTPSGLTAAAPAIPAAGMSESQGNTKPPGAAAPRLQNRDRSDAAYIQQMQAIGKNPDPDRLGVDRNMATGAPIVLADAVPAAQLGRVDRVVTAAGRKFPVQYAVVEAADLLPSNSADGTANAGYAEGLPGRARVVAGNGRAAGLQLAFTNGNAAGYVQGITADASDHGVKPATLAAMKQPVLVRIMQPADVTANIGDESNVSGVADKSAKEAARDDARRLYLGTLDFNDDGTLTSAALDAFVAAMPPSEQTALRDSDGAPTKQAQDRLMAAVFQTAYDDDALLALYSQAIDPEARVVMAGLAAAAPQMMMLKGAGILDIRALVSDAAQQAINARRRGIKLADMAAQSDLDRDAGVSAVLGMFARNSRSAKRIGEELRAVAQFAYDEANKPAEDIFGPVPRASRADVLERLNDARSPQSLENARRGSTPESDVQGRPAAAAGPGNDGAVQADRPAQDAQAEDLAEAPTAEPFKTNGQALVYAAQNGIAGKVKPVEVTGGWALVPKERAPSVLTAEADAKALEAANTALAKSKWRTPAGKPWKLKPAKNVPAIFKTVAAIIDAGFGVRVQAVNGAPGNGLQFGRGAFVDTARVTSPETLIGVTGHEVKHWLDANDKATGAKLDQAIEQHLKAGAVQAQMARENAQLVAGEAPMTEAGARLELLSDINGALWVDPDFWGRLYDIDSSAFRKVLYQFMRAATKFIKVAQGSTFDLTAYVDNVAAVRDAAAQAMVERAENRRGKAGPQMLVKNARRGRPSPLDQDLFAQQAEIDTGPAPAAQPAPASTPTPAQADDFNLTAPTRGDVLAQQQARADETKAEAARRRARDEGERRDREQREIADRARQDASAENFVLGQNADEALAGQNSLFEPDAPYETDLFGNPLPAAAARGRGSWRDRQAAQAGDVLAQPGVQGQEAPRGRYATRTQLVTTRQQTLGHAGPIRSLADAAHALSYLGKSAVERLDVLVTDAKDRPLAVVGGFKGAIDMAPVYKGTLVGEVMRIPDAANLWMVHNHPSGKSLLSRADELLLEQMAGAFTGTAIRPRAIIALGRQEWSGVDEAGNPDRRQPMKPAQAGPTVPAQERRIEVDELLGPEINSPTNAKEAVKAHTDYFMGQPGILLLNKQQAPLAFVPWRSEDAMPLKDNGKLDALYRAVSFSNAATAIIATGSSMPIRSAQNLAAGLARIDVNTLDIIDSSGTSAAERGEVINPGILMSRAAALDFANETDQSKIVNAIDLTATPEEKVAQLVRMTEDNAPIVKALLERIDAAFGVKSKDNRKDPANILSKASRPSILAKKPWHGVEHIRDSYRFKTDLQSITQLPGIVRMLEESGVQIIKRDVDKLLEPQEWGWRIVAFDLRMPNGQLVEYYLPVSEMEAAKKAKGHLLFEEWRNLDQASLTPEQLAQRAVTVQESRDLYQAAWDAYLARTGDSEDAIRAALSSAAAASPSTRLYRSSSRLPSLTDGAGETQTPAALRMAENLPSNTKAADEPSESTQPNAADLPIGFIASSFGSSIPPTAQPAGAEYARLADPFADNYARLEGRKVSFDVRIEDTGQTATFTVDAAQYLRELDQRRDVARRLADCVAR